MSPTQQDDTVELNDVEARLLARRLIINRVRQADDFPLWEDMPLLSENAFLRLCEAVVSETDTLAWELRKHEDWADVDAVYLLQRAQG